MNPLEETIYKLETNLLTPEVRTSVSDLDRLIADDFIEYGSSGLIYDKKIILERLPQGLSPKYTLTDFELIVLSDSIVQTRFKTNRVNLDGTKRSSLHSSLWRNSDKGWQMFFNQGTFIS